MKNFFDNLLNADNPTSSRRFTAMVGLVLFLIESGCLIAGLNVPEYLLYTTTGLIISALGLAALK